MNQHRQQASDRADVLRELHHGDEVLVLVNAWDVASAREIAAVPGCRAIATASESIARAHGYPDGEQIPVDLMLDTIGRIVRAVDVPVTADLEAGYDDVRTTFARAIDLGVAGANLEDRLQPLDVAAHAVATAVTTAGRAGVPIVLNARTDAFLLGEGSSEEERLADALGRGAAYLDSGADCVFVPGVVSETSIAALAERFGPGRLSLLAVPGLPSRARLQQMGVARVSHGPYPHRAALSALAQYAGRAYSEIEAG